MNFSLCFTSSSANLVCWSPDGKYLAVPDKTKLYIKDGNSASSLLVSFSCCSTVKLLQWSPDSSLIMTGTPAVSGNKGMLPSSFSSTVEVWKLSDPDWRCKIDVGSAGLHSASWAPDSRHIITTDCFFVHMAVWSLVNQSITTIKNPKQCNPGYQFSSDGAYLAVAERIKCRDFLTILETQTWRTIRKFAVNCVDMEGLAWGCGNDSGSPAAIAVWDSVLTYSVTVYALCGRLLAIVKGSEPYGLGVRVVCWTPSGHHLILGGQDTKLCVMRHLSWTIASEHLHSTLIDTPAFSDDLDAFTPSPPTRVYREVKGAPGAVSTPLGGRAYVEVVERPVKLSLQRDGHVGGVSLEGKGLGTGGCPVLHPGGLGDLCEIGAEGCSGGVTCLLVSCDGRYAATCVQQLPSVVWVWALPSLSPIAVLVHEANVRDLSWSPRHSRLVITTGVDTLFVWTACGCLTIPIPPQLRILPTAVRWHPSGNRLLVIGRREGQFCLCSLPSPCLGRSFTPDTDNFTRP